MSGTAEGIEVTLARTQDSALVQISDCGCGIANPENLFAPFFTTKPGGTGIGLALSRQIIEAHGGTLTLANRADRLGCTARAVLPAAEERVTRPWRAAADIADSPVVVGYACEVSNSLR